MRAGRDRVSRLTVVHLRAVAGTTPPPLRFDGRDRTDRHAVSRYKLAKQLQSHSCTSLHREILAGWLFKQNLAQEGFQRSTLQLGPVAVGMEINSINEPHGART